MAQVKQLHHLQYCQKSGTARSLSMLMKSLADYRYKLGLRNFFNLYKDVVDTWTLIDNASNPRQLVATSEEILNVELYKTIESYVRE